MTIELAPNQLDPGSAMSGTRVAGYSSTPQSVSETSASHLKPVSPPASAPPPPEACRPHLEHLAKAVDALARVEPADFDMDASIAVAKAAERVSRAAEAAIIRCIRLWQDRGDPVQTPETTEEELSWRVADAARKALIIELGRSRSEAARLIATAKDLRKDKPSAEALRVGEISAPQARLIAKTLTLLGKEPDEVVSTTRSTLIARAKSEGTEGLRRSAEDIAHRVAPAAVLNRARVAEDKRRFFLTPVPDGYIPGGFLPTTGAEALLTVLDAMAETPSPGEENGQAKVRADALVRLAEDQLRTGELPQRRNGPTAMTIVMRADTALGLPDSPPAVTGYGQTVPAAEAHLLACESALRAVLVDGEGEILWQGRRRRLASRAQYEALAVRDGGCTVPTCDRPARECDAHHVIPWTEGGHTDVEQMRLLCRRHHRELHDELWQRQYGWQEAELRVLNEKRKFTEPRRPWYVDTPAWYPGPSPWAPGNGAEGSKVTVGQGEEAEKEGDPYPQAA